MAVTVVCPECDAKSSVGDEILGKKIRCKACQAIFVAEAAKAKVAAGRPAARVVVVADDDAPRRKKPAKAAGKSNLGVIIGAAVAGLVVLVGGGIGAVMMLNKGDNEGDKQQVAVPPSLITPPKVPNNDVAIDPPKQPAASAETAMSTIADGYAKLVPSQPRPTDIRQEVLDKCKKSALLITVKSEEGTGYGSGWFIERGVAITNAHVVGMVNPAAPAPEMIQVTTDSGLPTERVFTAKLLGLDRENDLAVLQIKGKDLPDPFTVVPSASLLESQKIYTLGFPHGKFLGDELGGGLKTTLKVRQTTLTGRAFKKDGSVKYIQIEGASDPGNSGSGIVDTNGCVIATHVRSADGGASLKFSIPSEYAVRLVQGRVLGFSTGALYTSGPGVKMPFNLIVADPLQRIEKLRVEMWVGEPGKPRSFSYVRPVPSTGDGPRYTADVAYDASRQKKLGEALEVRGTIDLPPLPAGKVYWFQPHYSGKIGGERWGEAVPVELDYLPVDQKPINLSVNHKANLNVDRFVRLQSNSVELMAISGRGERRVGMDLTAKMVERTTSLEPEGEATLRYKYEDLRMSDADEDSQYRGQLRGMLESAKGLTTTVKATKEGLIKSPRSDMANVAPQYRPYMNMFNARLTSSLEAMCISLPNAEVKVGEPWKSEFNINISVAGKSVNGLFRVENTYHGVRERNGRQEAVISIDAKIVKEGESDSKANDDDDDKSRLKKGLHGFAHGSATIDVATGSVLMAAIESEFAIALELAPNVEAIVGGTQLANIYRTSKKDELSKEVNFDRILPNLVRKYNPMVGAPTSAGGFTEEVQTAATLPSTEEGVLYKMMKPETVEKLKKSSVLVRCFSDEGAGDGSGWFTDSKGIVVTNAHVVGMVDKAGRPPRKLLVVMNSGEENQRVFEGKLLALNRVDDLAVIKIEGDNLPEPLEIEPSATLTEAQKMAVVGFPHGTSLDRELRKGIETDSFKTTVKIRQTTCTGRHFYNNGTVKYVQIEGAADPGNSGGPVVDMNGKVRSVLVAGIPGTRLVFTIPGEYPARMLQGYVLEVGIEAPYFDDNRKIKMPVKATVLDPLRRVKDMEIITWTGSVAPYVVGGEKPAPKKPGESERVTAPMKLDWTQKIDPHDVNPFGVGEVEIPPPEMGKVNWVQVKYTNGTGKTVYSDAYPYTSFMHPIDRKPVKLANINKLKAQRIVDLHSVVSVRADLLGEGDQHAMDLKSTLSEQVTKINTNGDAIVAMAYQDVQFPKVRVRSQAEANSMVRYLTLIKQSLQGIPTEALVSREGAMKKYATDYRRLPVQAQLVVSRYNDQVMTSIRSLSVPLPNKEVKPGYTWNVPSSLLIDTRKSSQGALFEMTYTYQGIHNRGGREEAVLTMVGNLKKDPNSKATPIEAPDGEPAGETPAAGATGTQERQPKAPPKLDPSKAKGLYGKAKGIAYVDLVTGQVVFAEAEIDLEIEIPSKDPENPAATQQTGAKMTLKLERRPG